MDNTNKKVAKSFTPRFNRRKYADLRNKDLEPVLGSSGVTSEVISGKRKPSKRQVKKLASFFGVSPKFFVSID
jgi:antitoxin component HigA of HigAB toxin-antitoxin module